MKKALIIMTLLLATTSIAAQSLVERASAHITFSKRNFADTIRIRIMDGAVIVPVEMDGSIRNLLFDTGAQTGLWLGPNEDWMEPLELDSMTVIDANETRMKQAGYLSTIKLGGLVIENYPFITGDAEQLFACSRFDGAVGFNLVGKGLSFKIDTQDSLLIVTDRKGFFDEEERMRPTVKYKMVRKSRPLIDVELPFGVLQTVFDTGSLNSWVDLPQKQLNTWIGRNKKKRKAVDDLTIQTDSTLDSGVGIYGLAKDSIEARLLRIPSLTIGELTINDLYMSTAKHSSRVGSALLKHASLIIDSHKKRFVFIPHNDQPTITVGNKEAGSLRFIPSEPGDTLGALKAIVRKGSIAYEKGIRTGDYLIEADGTPIPDVCTYILMEKKDEEVLLKFRSPDGTTKQATLKRTH